MDTRRATSSLQRLLPTQSVALHLSPPECLRTLGLLYHLENGNQIRLEASGNTRIHTLLEDADANQCTNTTYHVQGLATLEPATLNDILEGTQRIDPPAHGASALQQRRQKTVHAEAQKIIDQVLSRDFVNEMWKAGIRVTGTFTTFTDGTPTVTFTILLSDDVVGSVDIDSFSGRLILNDRLVDDVYIRAEQVQQHVLGLVDAFLDN